MNVAQRLNPFVNTERTERTERTELERKYNLFVFRYFFSKTARIASLSALHRSSASRSWSAIRIRVRWVHSPPGLDGPEQGNKRALGTLGAGRGTRRSIIRGWLWQPCNPSPASVRKRRLAHCRGGDNSHLALFGS